MNVYDVVTNRIIASLEKGIIPWQKPWKAEAGSPFPKNLFTGKAYRGVNVIMLWPGEFTSSSWLTFRQALAMGGHVRKGEKGMPIVFSKPVDPTEEKQRDEDQEQRRFIFRYSTVFNVEQCENLPTPIPTDPRPDIPPIERCEQMVDNWSNKPRCILSIRRNHAPSIVQVPTASTCPCATGSSTPSTTTKRSFTR